MMADLIDRQALLERLKFKRDSDTKYPKAKYAGLESAIAQVMKAPTIEAESVKHGRWVFEFNLAGSNFYRCSECDRQEVLLEKENILEFCPYCHCGAKMTEGE